MTNKFGLIALACIALASTSNVAWAAPQKSGKKMPTHKQHPTKSQPPVHGGKAPGVGSKGPAIEQGDSAWLSGKVTRIHVSANGRLTQLTLVVGSTVNTLSMASSCDANSRLVISQHPELLNAFDKGYTVSVLLEGASLNPRRFCVDQIAVAKP